jgi:4-amino-4-deoxy-L-arabinose transferase-like glycosyltransferase
MSWAAPPRSADPLLILPAMPIIQPPSESHVFILFLSLPAIVLLLALLTLNRLGAADVCGGSEAAMAVYVQQMIERHHLLFSLDNCSIPMYKPPLYHWTATALALLFHQATATPFNLRLPSALYAVATGILTMAFATKLLSLRGAILSGLILCGSYQYISQARIGLVDMTLTFCEALTLYAFVGWFLLDREAPAVAPRRTFFHYLLAVAMGLGVLAKGPVGVIVPGTAMLLFLMTEKNWTVLKDLFKPGPFIVGAAIASSWYLACLIGGRLNFLRLQIGTENFGRFFGSLGKMAPWYYLQPLLLNSLPLSLLVPVAVISALRRCTLRPTPSVGSACSQKLFAQTERAALAARFLAVFWIFTVVFFEFASFKRRAYLLPLWPASALLLAWWVVNRVIPRFERAHGSVIYRAAVGACVLLAVGNFLFIPAYELHGCGAPFTLGAFFRWPSAGFAGESSPDSGQIESYRQAAAQINRLTNVNRPLYVLGIRDALEPFVFYLDRCVQPLRPPMAIPTIGYTIVTTSTWDRASTHTSGLSMVARIPYDNNDFVLLRPNLSATSGRSSHAFRPPRQR